MMVINECRVSFKYRMSPTEPIILQTVFSNRVETNIIKKILLVEKRVDKKCTYTFDILTYIISITNVGDDTVTNVFVQDDIPKETQFIENSITMNNTIIRCVNPIDGFYIDDIKVGEKTIIKFKVLVLPQYIECEKNDIIKNCSTIGYDHLYNIEKPKDRISFDSNEVCTLSKNRVFNQITVDNELCICNFIDDVTDTKVNVKIIDIKIVNTPIKHDIGKVYTKDDINTCLVLVIGIIEYDITYQSMYKKSNSKCNKDKTKKITRKYYLEDVFGFSCNLVVPVGISYGNKYDLKFIIESSKTTIINPNTLYISTDILFYY